MSEQSFQARVWNDLTQISVAEFAEIIELQNKEKTKVVARLSYISWSVAWDILMSKYAESSYTFLEPEREDNGTMSVVCTVTIKEGESSFDRTMWLPVMDRRNNSIQKPTSRQISDTKMRCLVKALALCGLGIKLYGGDGLPNQTNDDVSSELRLKIGMVAASLRDLFEKDDSEGVNRTIDSLTDSEFELLSNGTPPEGFLMSKEKTAIGGHRNMFWKYLNEMKDKVMCEEDNSLLVEALAEMSPYAKKKLWSVLDVEEQNRINELKED